MPGSATVVVYLAGAREFHRPAETLGCHGQLDEQVRVANGLPLAEPPGPMPAKPATGRVQLLRLDRVAQALEDLQLARPVGFVFVLTDQGDANFGVRDTAPLAGVLARWCDARGFAYRHERLTRAPHRLDGGGEELIARLDEQLKHAKRVVLVAGGGTPALQIAAHFAAFQGVRHRDDVTVAQLEEIRQTGDEGVSRSGELVDTKVQTIQRFHRMIGQRTIDLQAVEELDALDLPGAAQLVRAARTAGLSDPESGSLAQRLLDGLARERPPKTHLDQLNDALSLAEVEWSRPGGSRVEALWYAGLATVDLLAPAWAVANGREGDLEEYIDRSVVDEYARAVKPPRGRDNWANLMMEWRPLKNARPILLAGPKDIILPGRVVSLDGIFGESFNGTHPAQMMIWAALLVTFKPLRNDYAHELIGLTRDDADRRLREISHDFLDRIEYLGSGGEAVSIALWKRRRIEAILPTLSPTTTPKIPAPQSGGIPLRPDLIARLAADPEAEATDRELIKFLSEANPTNLSELLSYLDDAVRSRLKSEARRLIDPTKMRAQLGGIPSKDQNVLDLTVSLTEPTSALRRVFRAVVPSLSEQNPLIVLASSLREQLTK